MRYISIVLVTALTFFVLSSAACSRQLNPDLPNFGDTSRTFVISDDGQWVVFAADNNVDSQFNLFSQSLNTSSMPVQLNVPAVDGGVMVNSIQESFTVTPDSTRVVYISQNTATDELNLYSALLDGSQPPLLLNIPSGPGTRVTAPLLITDNGAIVYRSNERNLTQGELFVVPADGSAAPVRVSQDFAADVSLSELVGLGGNDTQVIYTVFDSANDLWQLFAANLNNIGEIINLTAGLPTPTRRLESSAELITDTRVIFTYRADAEPTGLVYSALLDGSTPPDPVVDFDNGELLQFGPTSNSDVSLIAYMIRDANLQSIMQIVSADGSATPISIPAPNNNIFVDFAVFSADSQRVVAAVSDGTISSLYSFSLDGTGNPINLNNGSAQGLSLVEGYQITPDSRAAIFIAQDPDTNVARLFSAPVSGGQATLIDTQSVIFFVSSITGTFATEIYQPFTVTSDSQSVIYLAAGGRAFSASLDGSSSPVMLNDSLTNNGNLVEQVESFPPVIFGVAYGLNPSEDQFIYRADQSVDEQYELFAVGFPPLPAAAEVPTLSRWSLCLFILMISGFAYYFKTSRHESH